MLVPEVCWSDDDEARPPRPAQPVRWLAGVRPRRRRSKVLVGLAGVALLLGLGAGTTAWAAGGFSDVPSSHPFFGDISWMDFHNVSNGYPDGTFRPDDPVSRQAMSAFLRRYNFETSLVSVTIPLGSSTYYEATAACPAGKSAISGGGQIDSSNLFLTDSYPSGTGWYVRWESDDDAKVDSGGKVWALCKPNNSQS